VDGPDILLADIPAGGKASARAVVRMYAALLLLDEVDGVRLISPGRLGQVMAVAKSGIDEVFGNPSSWGLGFSLGRLWSAAEDTPTVFGMSGADGSHACADTATGIAFAVTKNRLTTDFGAVGKIGPRTMTVIFEVAWRSALSTKLARTRVIRSRSQHYRLTSQGHRLGPVLQALWDWGS
jgi:CubicO group peptidase (beta-lactamase class C family)